MGWPLWLRRLPEPDYESLLAQLETSIKARESHLLSIRLRERRANALFVTYGLGAWILYVALWWFGVVGAAAGGLERALGGVPVIGGPVVIIFTRRTLRWWYKRKQDREEATLRTLKKEQRDKVEELKRKTGYYSTRNLLEKYDDVIKKNDADTRGRPVPALGRGGLNPTLSTPQRPLYAGPSVPSTPTRGPLGPPGPLGTPQQPYPLLPPAPSTPVHRTLIDKLADALLGVAAEEAIPNSKYALICGKCFAHNGLVAKEEYDTIQYQCPRCGHFNPRRNVAARTPSPLQSRPSSALDSDVSHSSEGTGAGRWRVQSMHVPSTLRSDVEDVGSKTDGGQEKDEEKEGGEVVLEDAKEELKLRQRRRKGKAEDDMDTD